jgi:hypothetical protein
MKKHSHINKVATQQGSDDRPAVVKIKNYPTEEQIRQRAYELYKARGGRGHPLVDWLQAERELMTVALAAEKKCG